MNSNSLRTLRGQFLREAITLLLFASLTLQTMQAAAPGWWSDTSVLRPGATADDYAVANVGQLKNFASKAAQEMNASLVGGAGPEITALIAAWSNAPGGSMTRDDYAALSAGQLKAVAKKFYDRLAIAGNGIPGMYPWNGTNADDYALVNVGQLKAVFAFGIAMGTNALLAMADIDSDNDGFSDLDEYLSGTDLQNASSMPNGGYVSLSDDSNSDDGPDPEPVFSFYSRKKSEWGYLQGYPPLTDIPGGTPRLFRTRTIIDTYTGTETQNGSSASGSSSLSYSENLEYTTTDQYNSSVITGSIMASADESVLGVKRLTQDVNGQGTYSWSSNTSGAPLAYQFYNAEQTASGSFLDDSVKTELHGTEDISDYDNVVHTINNTYDGDNFQKNVSLAYSGSPPVSTEVEETASYQSTTHTYQFRNNGSNGSSSWNNAADVTTRSQIILSGEISLSELGQMVKSSLSAKDWPDDFVKSWGPSPPFATCDIYNYGLSMYATDVEYYVALEWPDGTPESVKQKPQQPREYSWIERYRSVDGVIDRTALRTVSLVPGQQSSHYIASAIDIDHTRSGDVGESVPSFALQAYEVLEDGTISTTPSSIMPSMPSPVIDLSCELKNVRIQADGRLVGDLELSGSITSKVCDTIQGPKGEVTTAQLWINDADQPQAAINVTSTKTADGPRNKPYPYSGSFEQTISAVPLTEGNNEFKITAEDKIYHFPGFNTWVANVQLDGPDDDDDDDEDDDDNSNNNAAGGLSVFAGLTAVNENFKLTTQLAFEGLDWTLPDDITVTIDLNGVVHSNVPLTETEDESGIFAGTLPDGRALQLTLDPTIYDLVENHRDVVPAELVIMQPDNNPVKYTVALTQSATVLSQFAGGRVISTFTVNPPNGGQGDAPPVGDTSSPPSLEITNGYAIPLAESNGGTLHQYMFGIDETEFGKWSLRIGEQMLDFIKDGSTGRTFLQQPGNPDKPLVTHLRDRGEAVNPQAGGFDENKLAEMRGKTYMQGVRAGLWQGGVDMVNDTGDLISGVWTYAEQHSAWIMLGASLIIKNSSWVGDEESTKDVMIDIGNEVEATNLQAAEMVQFLNDFIDPFLPVGPTRMEVFLLQLNGYSEEASQRAINASTVHQMVFNLTAEALKEMNKDYVTGSPGERGYITGRVMFEAASFVFGYVKVGKLPLLKQASEKAKFFTRLLKTNIPGKFMRQALVVLSKLDKITGMCFVGGTPVRTLEGLLPIEQVRAGMYVWSRDEVSGLAGWKRVMQNFTTHPSVLHRLTYELRGPPADGLLSLSAENHFEADTYGRTVSTETLGTTAPHPFYVRNREQPAFVAAAELQPGDEFFISGHRRAVLVSNNLEYAPAGETFTTYNFDVEDYHTYFVGRNSVWVHNTGDFPCRELFRAFRVTREKFNQNVWLTFKDMMVNPPAVWNQSWPDRWQVRLVNRVRNDYFKAVPSGNEPWLDVGKISAQVDFGKPWDPTIPSTTARDAETLKRNLMAVFDMKDPGNGFTPHHIVPKTWATPGNLQDASKKANQVLKRAGIDPDDARNGMFLPNRTLRQQGVDDYLYGPLHNGKPGIHNEEYVTALAKRLEEAENAGKNISTELQKIADEICEGTFPGVPKPLPGSQI